MDIKDQPLQANAPASPQPPVAPSQSDIAAESVQAAPVQSIPSSATRSDSAQTASILSTPASIPTEEHQTAKRSHKSLIIGIILAAIVVVSGLSVFIGFNNSSQYQGFLKKIEAETEKLQAQDAQKAASESPQSTESIPGDTFENPASALPPMPAETSPQAPAPADEAPAPDEGLTR
ncbi:hypothetical protein HY604_02185 [Candidatus Peregrinibacteria bacterium]|nr:hypothetical protein [Candidatus Peregrinibacteria bacterium]